MAKTYLGVFQRPYLSDGDSPEAFKGIIRKLKDYTFFEYKKQDFERAIDFTV